MNSVFALQDGHLEIIQIASKRLPTGRFSFLSTCHTAECILTLPEEAMHLAGALQSSGFPSVIGTMWSICDKDAPIMASHTYDYLLRKRFEGCDVPEVATALNHVVPCLHENLEVTVDRCMHLGI
jgi:CHAT domain-containing protein